MKLGHLSMKLKAGFKKKKILLANTKEPPGAMVHTEETCNDQ